MVDGAEVVRVEGPRQWLRFHRDRTTAEPQIEDVISGLSAGNQATAPNV